MIHERGTRAHESVGQKEIEKAIFTVSFFHSPAHARLCIFFCALSLRFRNGIALQRVRAADIWGDCYRFKRTELAVLYLSIIFDTSIFVLITSIFLARAMTNRCCPLSLSFVRRWPRALSLSFENEKPRALKITIHKRRVYMYGQKGHVE